MDWIKRNWLFLALASVIVLFIWREFANAKDYNGLWNIYTRQNENHRKRLEQQAKIENQLREELKLVEERYQSELVKIKEKHEADLREIVKRSNSRRTKIVNEAKEDPNTLVKRIEETFRIPYVEN